jgi:hypothetical protein
MGFMGRRRRTARQELEKHLRITRPDLVDPVSAVVSGLVRVTAGSSPTRATNRVGTHAVP